MFFLNCHNDVTFMLNDKSLELTFDKLNKLCFENKLIPISVFFVNSPKQKTAAGFVIFKDGNICIVIEENPYKSYSKKDMEHIVLHEMVHYYLYSIKKDPDHTILFYDKLLECYKKFVKTEEAWRIIMIGMEHDGFKIKENNKKSSLKIKLLRK